MKVNIYYGGRGVLDDPALHVVEKMEQVLIELNVDVHRYNIYEYKNEVSTLPQTMKEADGIILATTVEWMGIGGFMYQFLDACWLYGDKERMKKIYMQPVVMSTTYGEREGMLTLENAWEILGGIPCSGLCGYVEDIATFELNAEYAHIIEKKAENLYRTISQQQKGLPSSNQAVKNSVLHMRQVELTPQESEQLSHFVADENYVRQQKMDIEELSSMYRNLLGQQPAETSSTEFISSFRSRFMPQAGFRATYAFQIEGKQVDGRQKPLYVIVNGDDLVCHYGDGGMAADVHARLTSRTLSEIVAGRKTFQRAFGMGEMPAKGDLQKIRMLDTLFAFRG